MDWLPGQNPSAPGCLKDSPTPQRPSSVLSALSHPMMQLKIYHGKGKLAGWKGKSEEGMFYGVYVWIVSSWRFVRWNSLYYSNKAWIKSCCFNDVISSGRNSFEELYIWIDYLVRTPLPLVVSRILLLHRDHLLCWVLSVIQWCNSRSTMERES